MNLYFARKLPVSDHYVKFINSHAIILGNIRILVLLKGISINSTIYLHNF